MNQIVTANDIKKLGTILGVWAHPDDETFTMGGILAAAAGNGQKIVCVTATKGELGVQDESRWPAERLGAIRAKELEDAFGILGIKYHYWLDYPDGGCDAIEEQEAVKRIAALINEHQPDSIFTFGPDGMTGHTDHITVSRWATLAREQTGSKASLYYSIQTNKQYQSILKADKALNIFFNIDKPNTCNEDECEICFTLPDDVYDKKMAALGAMPSQTEAMLTHFGDTLRPSLGVEAFRLS